MSASHFISRTLALSRASYTRSTVQLQRRWVPRASYAGGGGLTREAISTRIIDTLKGYEKIDPAKACLFTYIL
jgi:NADH dehydrogenase (ubiquinone) 1 alpha/beta subcomplex 1